MIHLIKKTARKLKRETEIQQESSTPKSLETQALILLAEGRNQVDVAIALDIYKSGLNG